MEDDFYSPSLIIKSEQMVLVRQLGCVREAAYLFEELRPHAPASVDAWAEWDRHTLRLNVAARAFIYEATTLRQLIADVARRYPQFRDDAKVALSSFDNALPRLVELRNSQAHLDERLNFRARGHVIEVADRASVDPDGFGVISLPHVSGDSVQGTTETGNHAEISINVDSVAAAEAAVRRLFRLARRSIHSSGPAE